ncbi:hypothetical protein SAMN05443665_100673 [Actinomadura meyerae]|jgi:hypothetical protein|uniref:Uncharacterized protein n=1 Tax=Actinomadura meyerae TaxID=240840 RepID=A0A239FNY7_9ACTN|nr:hypothetical protein [Actinomadura meyerae]SNS57654.1 hypothetical protein SAMN05443665_100673 [Actinomadura meyerae]
MSERAPEGRAGDAGRPQEPQAGGFREVSEAEEVHPEPFRPDSTEGRGGRPEDLNPDDFE